MDELLIVEDDEGIRTQLKWALACEFKITLTENRTDALAAMKKSKPGVVMLDLGLPPHEDDSTEGFACLKEIMETYPNTKVIVVTGNDEKENAHQAIGLGAYDFYQKPVDVEGLKVVLNRAFYLAGLEGKFRKLRIQVAGDTHFEGIIGLCPKMEEVFSVIRKVATTDATVFVTGDSGTGKELVAQAIHSKSLRKDALFVPINCGSIPETLMESELFGYEKGAFTDAKSQKIGLVERASGGTLFLDEIGELPLHLQVKLLRFLQERKIQRVGGTKEIDVDLRIIAATNIDISKAVSDGKFREDLYYRISVLNLTLPPLRERGEDVVLIAKIFLVRFANHHGKNVKGFDQEALQAIRTYQWPGNIRELENKVQRAVIMSESPFVSPSELALTLPEGSSAVPEDGPEGVETLKAARMRAEIRVIQHSLARCKGNISHAAEELEISRPTLHQLVSKYKLK